MTESVDFDSWLRQIECPESYTSDHVKKALNKGVLGLLWESLSKNIKPIQEVDEVRKNILLYKLKHEPKDRLIQNVRNTVEIKEERKKLQDKIKNAEERWRRQEYICRQKVNLLEKKKEERQNVELKKDILQIKNEQMKLDIQNCTKMQEICHSLMPPSTEEMSQSTIIDCLSLVSNYSGGPEKRKVWNKVSELSNSIKIPVLWNALLKTRSHYTDLFVQMDVEEIQEKTSKSGYNIDIGIAKICNEHIDNVAKHFIHSGKMKNNELKTIEYIEKTEQIIEELRPDLSDWLPLTLEVKKLEILQIEFQREIEKLEEQSSEDNVMLNDVLMQLISEIKAIDDQTADCVKEIQNALGLLKSAGMLITRRKESLLIELEKLQLLQTNHENQWLDIDLSTELNVFHNSIDINALRKIMLKGETGTYKHLQTCYNKAPITIDFQINSSEITSNFPMLRVPVYYLVDLYKTIIVNTSLSKCISESMADSNEDFEELLDSPTMCFISENGILKLLQLTDEACKRTLQNSAEFEQILKTWSNQTVRETVSKIFCDKTVYGATLDEWQNRFSKIVYVLQKSNINA